MHRRPGSAGIKEDESRKKSRRFDRGLRGFSLAELKDRQEMAEGVMNRYSRIYENCSGHNRSDTRYAIVADRS